MRTLHFYFDYVSPYAYLASRRLAAAMSKLDVVVEPVPVLFAALLDHFGHKGPAEIPSKRELMFKDVVRRAARLQLPFALPPTHPFNPLLALRVSAAVDDGEARLRLSRELFASAWQHRAQLEDPEAVRDAIERAGLSSAPLLEAAQSDAVKQRLRDNTKVAIRRGVFGVPSYALGDELFWGSDVIDDLVLHAQGKDPVPPSFFRELVLLKPSATRRGSAGTK